MPAGKIHRSCSLIALALLGGCVSSARSRSPYAQEAAPASRDVLVSSTYATIYAHDPALRPAETGTARSARTSSGSAPASLADGGDAPRFAAPDAVAGGGFRANAGTSLVSLWGDELVDGEPLTASPADGSASVRQVSFASEGTTFDPDVDRSGTRLVFASTRHRATSDLYIKSTTGSTVTQLTSDPANDIMPAFDPSGRMVAFASDRSGSWDIWMVSASGGPAIQVTREDETELHPTWSPDGRRLAYCRFGTATGRWEIWMVDVENPATPSFLAFGVFPQWSPDIARNRILFQRARERGSQYHSIWTIDVVGNEARRPTEVVSAANAAAINPAWSPDGRKIVFVTVVEPDLQGPRLPHRSDVWVADADGTNRVNLSNGSFANYQPVWARGGTVYFVSNRSGVDNIWAVSAAGTDPATVVSVDASRRDGQP